MEQAQKRHKTNIPIGMIMPSYLFDDSCGGEFDRESSIV
jgi:hypothetical protein